ncbi:MAG: hypothetical protein KAX49_11075 [Halanaerobiales bacterium]|nr:hypothetical protein [Halanaerobiales bacterium]
MGKEKKPQNPHSNIEKDSSVEITSQKEINATLDLVIRTLANLEKSNEEKNFNNSNDNIKETADNEIIEDSDYSISTNKNKECSIKGEITRKKNRKKNINVEVGINTRILSKPELSIFLTCVDLFIFELDEEVLEKLVFCAILSTTLGKFLKRIKSTILIPKAIVLKVEEQLDKKIADVFNQFLLKTMNGIQTTGNKKDYLQTLFQSINLDSHNNEDLNALFTANLHNLLNIDGSIAALEETQKQFDLCIRNEALAFLCENFTAKFIEFQRAVNLKVRFVERDLRFLSQEIIRLTRSDQGIVQLAEALFRVTSARFAEEDNFNEIFDAVEEVADTIEELAKIYQDRLKVLRALFPFSNPLQLFDGSFDENKLLDDCDDCCNECD